MIDNRTRDLLVEWADKYNDPQYFQEDPIAFPRHFAGVGAPLQDVEVAAVFAAHFAWGRRAMIVRDITRLMDEMQWHPYDYVMAGQWRCDPVSIHRTVKWSEVAAICGRLRQWYLAHRSLEGMDASAMRSAVYGQKQDPKAPNKKINMLRRWICLLYTSPDLGLWKGSDPASLVIPLDVHVHEEALALGLTERRSRDLATAMEITDTFRRIWPQDPCKGDFALFGYGVTKKV